MRLAQGFQTEDVELCLESLREALNEESEGGLNGWDGDGYGYGDGDGDGDEYGDLESGGVIGNVGVAE